MSGNNDTSKSMSWKVRETALSHLKFRQCEDYSDESKPYFKPLTLAWQRFVLQREYFDFVRLYFH